jgi:sigma-B regulation protein RsbU (phosphoserine phosphatase)
MKISVIVNRITIRKICLEAEFFFKKWKIKDIESNDLVLAVEEALTNILEHGYDGQPEKNYSVTIEIFKVNKKVFILITDSGVQFCYHNIKSPEKSTYLRSYIIGGFGISIINKIMDEVIQFRLNNENVLIMSKSINFEKDYIDEKVMGLAYCSIDE